MLWMNRPTGECGKLLKTKRIIQKIMPFKKGRCANRKKRFPLGLAIREFWGGYQGTEEERVGTLGRTDRLKSVTGYSEIKTFIVMQ